MKCKNIFSAESFKAEFSKAFPEFRENPVEFFTEIDSTNSYAKRLLSKAKNLFDENGNLTEDGKVCGVKTVQVEFKNIDGSRRLCEIEGSEKELPCDLILIAAGFLGCEDYTAKAFNVKLSQRNTVESFGEETPEKASPNGYKTSEEKIFTAGDMHRGQSLVVWAIAEGRECAKEIDEYLMGYSNM